VDQSLVQQQGSAKLTNVRFQELDLSMRVMERLRGKGLLVHSLKLIRKTGARLRKEMLAIDILVNLGL
jgi:hypothetical protein